MKYKRNAILTLTLIGPLVASGFAYAKTTEIRFLVGNVESKEISVICQQFQKEHPEIKISPTVVSWDQVDNKFLAMMAGGVKVDVFCNNSAYGWARYTRQGLFTDLTPLITRDKKEINLDDFSELALNSYKYKGKQISLPIQHFLANSLSYNATMLNEAGLALPTTSWESKDWTWNEMVAYAKKLTKTGSDGRVTQWGIDFWGGDSLQTFAWAGGGDWLNAESYKEGIVKKLVINSSENLKAYTKVIDLSTVYRVKPGVAKSKAGAGIDAFRKGEIAFWMDAQQLQSSLWFKTKFKWGMAPFPVMESGVKNGFAWMEALAIPKSSQKKEAAWTFIKWMSRYGLSNSNVKWPQNSARQSMWDKALDWWPMDLCALSKTQLRQYVQGGIKYARPLPRDIVFGSQAVSTAVGAEIDKAFTGKVSVAQALATAQKAAEVEVKKYMRYK